MVEYEWISIAADRYVGPPSYRLSQKVSSQNWMDKDLFILASTANTNAIEIVESVVADFREAVAAQFYDAAKNDPTLVPISCVQYIDAIFYYNICLRLKIWFNGGMANPYAMVAPTIYTEWKRAVLYRRELGVFTKRVIAGNMFPEIIMDNLPSGTPSYFPKPTLRRSL
jgi:hypothetical protein